MYDLKFQHIIESFEQEIFDEESLKMRKIIEQEEKEKLNPASKAKKNKKKSTYDLMYAIDDNEDDYYNSDYKNIPGLLMKVWGKISWEKY